MSGYAFYAHFYFLRIIDLLFVRYVLVDSSLLPLENTDFLVMDHSFLMEAY